MFFKVYISEFNEVSILVNNDFTQCNNIPAFTLKSLISGAWFIILIKSLDVREDKKYQFSAFYEK